MQERSEMLQPSGELRFTAMTVDGQGGDLQYPMSLCGSQGDCFIPHYKQQYGVVGLLAVQRCYLAVLKYAGCLIC